ncbi:glutathione S-transferase [Nitzschia inconspicua]|uniref:Glutathione S-transferase n=1 Tax=Nitzschia inconspicua TaxID=303405 RepID=A0A9K3PK03_9STRA|nr:glutathione S-transferase [Nitzschia inconspicua]
MKNYRNLILTLASPVLVSAFVASRHRGTSTNWIIGSDNNLRTCRNPFPLYMSTNPFTSMIGDVASSLFGSKNVAANENAEAALKAISTPSWMELRNSLESQQTFEEKAFRQNLAKGYGVASPLHKARLYNESNKEEDIAVTFYRDSASWCPYCQKVWLALETKEIPYRVEKINMRCYGEKPSSFMRIQPGGQIPVAEINGRVYGQSNDILQALEDQFPNSKKSLLPPDNLQSQAQMLYGLERQLFSAWMYWLTGRSGGAKAKKEFIEVLRYVDTVLRKADSPFFLGKDISMVDVQFAPFLERMAASLLFYKGFMIRVPPGEKTDFPGVNSWFDAMEKLPSYQLTKSDYYTHCWDLPPQLGGCTHEPDGKQYEEAINGIRSLDGTQGSWELPLQQHNGGVEPDWTWVGDEATARREAVERVSANHEAIVKFACRGAGSKGMPPYMAPLSDPNAIPNEAMQKPVDMCLRMVCEALLDGEVEAHNSKMHDIATTIVSQGGKEYAEGVIASLTYLRDRVGVPRDMKLPAARQLRAHLNWSIGKILAAKDS